MMASQIENEALPYAPLIETGANDLIEGYSYSPLPLYRQVQLFAKKVATQQAKAQFQQKHPWISYLLGLLFELWFCRPAIQEIQTATINLIKRIKVVTKQCRKSKTEEVFNKIFSNIDEIAFAKKPAEKASYELFKNEFNLNNIEDHEIELLIYNELFDQPIFGKIQNPEQRKQFSEKFKRHSTLEQREAVLDQIAQKIRIKKPINPLEYLKTEKLQEKYCVFERYLKENQKSLYEEFQTLPHPIALQVFECAWINSETDRSLSKDPLFTVCEFLCEDGLVQKQNLTLLINFFNLKEEVASLNQSTFIKRSKEVDRMNGDLAQNLIIDNTSVINDLNRYTNLSIRFDDLTLISHNSDNPVNIQDFDKFLQDKGIIDPDHREIIGNFSTQSFSNEAAALTVPYLINTIPNLDFSKYPLGLSEKLDLSIEKKSEDRITIKRTVKGKITDTNLSISDRNIPIEVTCTFELQKYPNGAWRCDNKPILTLKTHSNSERFEEVSAPKRYLEYDDSSIKYDAYGEPLHEERLDSNYDDSSIKYDAYGELLREERLDSITGYLDE